MSEEVHDLKPPVFSRDNLPSLVNAGSYRQKAATKAIRIIGAFSVDYGGGLVSSCEDGYLCVDGTGNPFPIPKKEFLKRYTVTKGSVLT